MTGRRETEGSPAPWSSQSHAAASLEFLAEAHATYQAVSAGASSRCLASRTGLQQRMQAMPVPSPDVVRAAIDRRAADHQALQRWLDDALAQINAAPA